MRLQKTVFWAACLLIVVVGASCIQPAGSSVDTFGSGENLNPTWTPSPVAPLVVTQQVIEQVVVTATQDPNVFVFPTQDPNAFALQFPTATVDIFAQQQNIDPILITATYIVYRSTATQAYYLTATAGGFFGFATATPSPFFDPNAYLTLTPVNNNPNFVSGTNCVHEVRASDINLYRISLVYGVTWQAIAQASGLVNANLIYPGQKLIIPGCGTTGVFPPATSIPTGVATVDPLLGFATATPNFIGTGSTYTVQQGDTLFGISLKYGVSVASIAAANGISNWDRIYLNQQLTIPAS